jgi:hypothetical protein
MGAAREGAGYWQLLSRQCVRAVKRLRRRRRRQRGGRGSILSGSRGQAGCKPLIVAAGWGFEPVVRELVAARADVNAASEVLEHAGGNNALS